MSIRVFTISPSLTMMILMVLLALVAASACSTSPNKNAAHTDSPSPTLPIVETKSDRLSGVTTIVMNPQDVIDNRDLTLWMSSKYRTGGEASGKTVYMNFEGESAVQLDFSDRRLYFLADGMSVSSDLFLCGAVRGLRTKLEISNCKADMSPLRLNQIAESKRVEMNFGTYELEIKPPLLAALRQFMNQVKAYTKDGLR
jgi:hypothetical protein